MSKNFNRKQRRAQLIEQGQARTVVLNRLGPSIRESLENLKSDDGLQQVEKSMQREMFRPGLTRKVNYPAAMVELSRHSSTRSDGQVMHFAMARAVGV